MTLPRSAQLIELLCLSALAASLAGSLSLHAGYLGWSWDALNHHIYLGYMAESSRLHWDVMAASGQSYQYPYLYWPVYRLSLLNAQGAWVGAAWSAFQALCVLPPVWWASLQLLPDGSSPWRGRALRGAACAMAFFSAVVLTGLETTGNDLLAAVPLLWAMVLLLGRPDNHRRAFFAAALWGVSAAFKLSNALFLPLLLLWLWVPGEPWSWPWRRAQAMAGGATLGFVLAYGPWGWQLWQLTGNPMYPYLVPWFGPHMVQMH